MTKQYSELYKTYSLEIEYLLKKEKELLNNPTYVEIMDRYRENNKAYNSVLFIHGYKSTEFEKYQYEHEMIKKEALAMEYKMGFTSINFLYDYLTSEAYKLILEYGKL